MKIKKHLWNHHLANVSKWGGFSSTLGILICPYEIIPHITWVPISSQPRVLHQPRCHRLGTRFNSPWNPRVFDMEISMGPQQCGLANKKTRFCSLPLQIRLVFRGARLKKGGGRLSIPNPFMFDSSHFEEALPTSFNWEKKIAKTLGMNQDASIPASSKTILLIDPDNCQLHQRLTFPWGEGNVWNHQKSALPGHRTLRRSMASTEITSNRTFHSKGRKKKKNTARMTGWFHAWNKNNGTLPMKDCIYRPFCSYSVLVSLSLCVFHFVPCTFFMLQEFNG